VDHHHLEPLGVAAVDLVAGTPGLAALDHPATLAWAGSRRRQDAVVFGMLWIFAGLVFIGAVLWYWLRKIARALAATGAVQEAALNRAATNRGDRPISDDVDTRAIF
jgi:hypothetical protein